MVRSDGGDEVWHLTHDVTPMQQTALALMERRPQIEAALAHADGTMDFWDVVDRVEREQMQFWPLPHGVVLTEIIAYPQGKSLHIALAGGHMGEIEAAAPYILRWGALMGCDKAHLLGRPGWKRSFLTKTGWQVSEKVLLTKELSLTEGEK